MNIYNFLKPYAQDDKYYKAEGARALYNYLAAYGEAHPWFHCSVMLIEDSNTEHYFHYAVMYWTEGQQPVLESFSFKN